ncbi:MAG: NAD(P)H-binding protein [Chthoniobacterales bacterium]|nr:NAD(P)H-binding protein [Chthoniobacterales bacterium]
MNITIFGAAGDVGTRIVDEALARGHEVAGVVRDKVQFDKLSTKVRCVVADASDPEQVRRAAHGQDLIISAVRPPEGEEDAMISLTRALLDGAAVAGVRILLVGGAARLLLPDGGGETVLSAADFLPASIVAIARASQAQYELCLGETRAAWTYLSPPGMLEPGERTGRYRLGADTLLVDEGGVSRISMEDLAVAMLDEAEAPKHVRRAFTVGY